MTPNIEILDQNFAYFNRFQELFLTNSGVKKLI